MSRSSFKRISATAVLGVMLMTSSVYAFGADLSIQNFNTKVTVGNDRSCKFAETLDVKFYLPMHGIYRYIPESTSYRMDDVTASGEYTVSDSNENKLIKIGSESTTVTGVHSYNISYTLVYPKDEQKDFDYVYLNLLGKTNTMYAEKFTAEITMPTADINEAEIIAGRSDAEKSNIQPYINGNTISFSLSKVEAGTGITIRVKVPEGTFVNAPSSIHPTARKVAVGAGIFALLMLIFGILFFLKESKSRQVIAPVEFYPPDEMSPLEAGYVIDMEASVKDAVTLIYYWASKGYLTIEEKDNDFTLRKVKDIAADRPLYEKKCFNAMWKKGDEVTEDELFKSNFNQTLKDAAAGTTGAFTGKRALESKSIVVTRVLLLIAGMLPCILMVLCLMSISTMEMSQKLLALVFSVLAPPCIYALLMHKAVNAQAKTGTAKMAVKIIVGTVILLSIFVVIFAQFFSGDSFVLFTGVYIFAFAVMILMMLLASFATSRTEYGQSILGRIKGFRDFLKTAEKEKLEEMLASNPSYYYDILPFAQVLGVSTIWAKKFKDLVMDPPTWYTGYYAPGYFNLMMFNNSFTRLGNTVSAPLNNDKFGGGGGFGGGGVSLGGGGGGGGVGGW